MLIRPLTYHYIKQQKINEIMKMHQSSPVQKVKSMILVAKYICMQGYNDAKTDINYYIKTRNISKLTSEQRKIRLRIRKDLYKLPPIALLFCVPGGFPLVLGYVTFFSFLSPSWIQTDEYALQQDEICKKKQINSIKFFVKTKGIIRNQKGMYDTNITMKVFQWLPMCEQVKLAELCYGSALTGTSYINRIFKTSVPYLISQQLSKYLIQFDLQNRLNAECTQTLASQAGSVCQDDLNNKIRVIAHQYDELL